MIIDQLVIFFSVIDKIKNLFFKTIFFLTIIFFFICSIFIVNHVRDVKWDIQTFKTNNDVQGLKKNVSKLHQFTTLFMHRWVGIDGLSNVVNYKDKNLNFYLDALKEKKNQE